MPNPPSSPGGASFNRTFLYSAALIVVILVWTCLHVPIFAQSTPTVTVSNASIVVSGQGDIPISFLAAGAEITSLQYDISFPSPITFISLSAGAAASNAGKSVTATLLSSTVLRVSITGANTIALGSGELCVVRFSVPSNANCDNEVVVSGIEAFDQASQPVVTNGIAGRLLIGPAVPTGLTPIDGAVDIVPGTILQWPGSAGATSYDLYFGETSDPPFYITCLGFSPYGASPPGEPGMTYYWRVVAKNACTGSSTPVMSFKTCTPPSAPTLLNPPDDAIDMGTPVDLSWGAVPGATKYRIYLGGRPDALSVLREVFAADPVSLSATFGTTYYWKVIALSPCGESAPSAIYKFTTCTSPGAPSGMQPPYGATAVPLNTILSWSPSPGATSYEVAFGSVDPPPVVMETTETTFAPPPLANDTPYFWRVTAKNSCFAVQSSLYSFVTCGIPRAPYGLAPANGVVDRPLDQGISWWEMPGVTSFDVYFGADPSPPLVTNTKGTSYRSPTSLLPSTTYYWKIVGRNDCYEGIPSATFSFTTTDCTSQPPVPTGL